MKNKVELTIFMDIFKVEIPNGLREDKSKYSEYKIKGVK